jgi:hypothetical protein
MEVTGLVLGTVVLVKPLCATINDTWSTYKSFGKDSERLRTRFAVQQHLLESFERVLFEENKFVPYMPGRLIDHLPPKVCNNLLALLRQLYDMLFEYVAVRAQYKIEDSRVNKDDATAESASNLTAEERMKALILEGKKTDAAGQKAVSWARKMLWVFIDKNSTEKLVGEFEAWTGRMKAFLETAWWPLPFFETVARMQKLEEDGDARNVGLLEGIRIRKLLATPSAAIPVEARQSLEIPAFRFRPESRFGDSELGHLQEDVGTTPATTATTTTTTNTSKSPLYMVEYKHYDRRRIHVSDTVIKQRIIQLAALLHTAPETDPALKVLKCVNYFDDVPKSRIGFIYALQLTPSESPRRPQPTSLSTLLATEGLRPTLETRMRLSHTLALSLQRLHAYSWLHKSLRSENILFFPTTEEPMSSTRATKLAITTLTSDQADLCMENPRIAGFEYARLESDFSDGYGEADIKRNIYRHPARWEQPSEHFAKVHDIYGIPLPFYFTPPTTKPQKTSLTNTPSPWSPPPRDRALGSRLPALHMGHDLSSFGAQPCRRAADAAEVCVSETGVLYRGAISGCCSCVPEWGMGRWRCRGGLWGFNGGVGARWERSAAGGDWG